MFPFPVRALGAWLALLVAAPQATATMWEIESGVDCHITEQGTCFTDGAGSYGNGERCTIRATQQLYAYSTYFNTEAQYDHIRIGSCEYSGTTGPSYVRMSAGQTISWTSDSSSTREGFVICGSASAPGEHTDRDGDGGGCGPAETHSGASSILVLIGLCVCCGGPALFFYAVVRAQRAERQRIIHTPQAAEIKPVEGWDGVASPLAVHKVDLEMEPRGDRDEQLALNAIVLPQYAGQGYRLKDCLMPVDVEKRNALDTGTPSDNRLCVTLPPLRATMFFQQTAEAMGAPLETKILKFTITYLGSLFDVQNRLEAQGVGEMFATLNQVGAEGFSLSHVVEIDPRGASTSVHLVWQRPTNTPVSPKQYKVASVGVYHSGRRMGRSYHGKPLGSASIPQLEPTLTAHFHGGYKLAAVYFTPRATTKGQVIGHRFESPCHLIFEQTQEPYAFRAVSAHFELLGRGHRDHRRYSFWKVDHSPYQATINNHVANGWELAGVIVMPDGIKKSALGDETLHTVQLIFQAKLCAVTGAAAASEAGAAGSMPVAVPIATPVGEKPNAPLVTAVAVATNV